MTSILASVDPGSALSDMLSHPFMRYAFIAGTGIAAGGIWDKVRAARERWGFSYFTLFGHSLEATPVVIELAGRIRPPRTRALPGAHRTHTPNVRR